MVTTDRMTDDELMAPLESIMMHSVWRVVYNAGLAKDCLRGVLAAIWKKRLQIHLHPNPQDLILKISLNGACDSLRKLERIIYQAGLPRSENSPILSEQSAGQDLGEKEIEAQIHKALRNLSQKRALTVLMKVIQKESFEAVVQALEREGTTVRILLFRSRATSGNEYPQCGKEAGVMSAAENTNMSDADLDNLLTWTLKKDLPYEVETCMRLHDGRIQSGKTEAKTDG